MTNRRWRHGVASFLIASLAFWSVARLTKAADSPQKPKLIVLVVFDQLRGDYPFRWHEYFSQGGFRRLERGRNMVHELPLSIFLHANRAGPRVAVHGLLTEPTWNRRQRLVRRAEGETVHCTTHSRISPSIRILCLKNRKRNQTQEMPVQSPRPSSHPAQDVQTGCWCRRLPMHSKTLPEAGLECFRPR